MIQPSRETNSLMVELAREMSQSKENARMADVMGYLTAIVDGGKVTPNLMCVFGFHVVTMAQDRMSNDQIDAMVLVYDQLRMLNDVIQEEIPREASDIINRAKASSAKATKH